ncbi:MAG: hypothetical protein H6733_03085 [Alphaproteobacteria bacterium]|nr:hypothetical protein [Alphaproteobacteria bacterium]
MLRIDLVFADEDASTTQLRNNVRDALHLLDLAPRWTEWRAAHPDLPGFARGQPTPSVFVGEKRVTAADGTLPGRATVMMAIQESVARR